MIERLYGELFRRVLQPTWETRLRHRPTAGKLNFQAIKISQRHQSAEKRRPLRHVLQQGHPRILVRALPDVKRVPCTGTNQSFLNRRTRIGRRA